MQTRPDWGHLAAQSSCLRAFSLPPSLWLGQNQKGSTAFIFLFIHTPQADARGSPLAKAARVETRGAGRGWMGRDGTGRDRESPGSRFGAGRDPRTCSAVPAAPGAGLGLGMEMELQLELGLCAHCAPLAARRGDAGNGFVQKTPEAEPSAAVFFFFFLLFPFFFFSGSCCCGTGERGGDGRAR